MTGILDGIRVLDFGRYIAGPLCGALLADLGADVIRIEKPGGADDRFIMPASDTGDGALYLHSNRGKRAIELETGHPDGRAVVERMVAQSDVVIVNLSPAAQRHFGLDYQTLRAIKPDVILTEVTAFGSSGPMSEAPGYDGVGQAVSGAVHLTGEPGHPHRSATAYVDFSTATCAAFGTLAAILRKYRTGKGGVVEASLVGTALNVMAPILIEHASGRHERVPTGNRAPIAGPSDIFRARDGWFIMQVQGPKMFRRWCDLVGRPELANDPRFANDQLRGRNGADLSEIMAEWSVSRTVEGAMADLKAGGLAASPVLSPDQVLADELGLMSAFSRPIGYPGAPGLRLFDPPVHVRGDDSSRDTRPPLLGEHTRTVLGEFGLSGAELDALAVAGVIPG
jgi:crotonobetainyl-CoA:carnitine CoA-transferase CaiB-like acyl-CoA transferase